jgi:hypothetical protein
LFWVARWFPTSPTHQPGRAEGARRPNFALQIAVNIGKHGGQAGAECGQRADDGDCDQSGNQAVFDSGGTVFAPQELVALIILKSPVVLILRNFNKASLHMSIKA